MKVSVALCTLNGAAHLGDQLRSLSAQDRSIDELVVCDDGSQDGTIEAITQFAETASCPVDLTVNPSRLGSTKNFEQAIAKCRGDVIALCDQDDVWLPQKLSRIIEGLDAPSKAAFAFSDAVLVDSDLNPIGASLWRTIGLTARARTMMVEGSGLLWLLKRYAVTGATLAFRATYRDLILPIPDVWIHDAWIALVLSAVSPCAPVEEPLIWYRQHADQQIGARRLTLVEQYFRAREQGIAHYERVRDMFVTARDRLSNASRIGYAVDPRVLRRLDEKLAHCEARVAMRRDGRRLRRVFGECLRGRYSRYSLGWGAVAQDLLL